MILYFREADSLELALTRNHHTTVNPSQTVILWYAIASKTPKMMPRWPKASHESRPYLNQVESQSEEGKPVLGRDPVPRKSSGNSKGDIYRNIGGFALKY